MGARVQLPRQPSRPRALAHGGRRPDGPPLPDGFAPSGPAERRRQGYFFRRASHHLRRFGAAPPRPVSRSAEATLRACLYRGDLRAFDALRRAKRGVTKAASYRRKVVRVAQTVRRKATTAARLLLYRFHLRRSLDPQLAIFASYWYRGVTGNPLAVYRAMRQLAPDLRGVWVVRPDQRHTVPAGVEHVVAGGRRYWRLMARATYFVNDVNFPDDIRNVWAGTHPDPARDAVEAHGAGPHGASGWHPKGWSSGPCSTMRPLGLQLVQQPVLDRGLGTRLPQHVHLCGVGLPPQ